MRERERDRGTGKEEEEVFMTFIRPKWYSMKGTSLILQLWHQLQFKFHSFTQVLCLEFGTLKLRLINLNFFSLYWLSNLTLSLDKWLFKKIFNTESWRCHNFALNSFSSSSLGWAWRMSVSILILKVSHFWVDGEKRRNFSSLYSMKDSHDVNCELSQNEFGRKKQNLSGGLKWFVKPDKAREWHVN